MDKQVQSPRIRITVVKALNLPQSKGYTPKAFVLITVGSDKQKTGAVQGSNPVWNKSFIFNARPGSEVIIHIFHETSDRRIADAKTSIKPECFEAGYSAANEMYELHLSASSFIPWKNSSSIVLSFSPVQLGESSNLDTSAPGASPQQELGILRNVVENAESLSITQTGSSTIPTVMTAPWQDLAMLENMAKTTGSPVMPSSKFVTVLGYLERFVEIGSAVAEVHPYAKMAWGLLTVGQKILQAQYERDIKVQDLWEAISDALSFMKQAEPLKAIQGLEETTQAIMKQIYECGTFLKQHEKKSFTVRALKSIASVKTDNILKQFKDSFLELQSKFNLRVNVDQWKIIQTTKDGVVMLSAKLDRVARITEDSWLENLPGAKLSGVQWNPQQVCLPGTRTVLLDNILQWVHSGSFGVLWLSGAAGTGKSSVANSIAERLYTVKQLGAFFQFHRDAAGDDTPGHLFGSIACQLAFFDQQIRDSVLSVMQQNGSFNSVSLEIQARDLVSGPLKSINLLRPIVIIVDALDESGHDSDKNGKPGRHVLVQALAKQFSTLPSFVKVLITSREEGSIVEILSENSSILHWDMANVAGTEDDIIAYVHFRFDNIRQKYKLPVTWPGRDQEVKLASYADGLFIWAEVACSYIKDGPDPRSKLRQLMKQFSSNVNIAAERKLDQLYTQILDNSYQSNDDTDINNWLYVVGTIVILQTPLNHQVMDALLGLCDMSDAKTLINGWEIELTSSRFITSQLLPILSSHKEEIRLLHKSVFDFLTKRAKDPFRIDVNLHNSILAMQCFEQMNQNLKYNICELQDTSVLNEDLGYIPKLTKKYIPKALEYACFYFVNHLIDGTMESGLMLELDMFLNNHVLHWIEVMAWLGKLYEAEESLKYLSKFLGRTVDASDRLLELVSNCLSMLRCAGYAISKGPLHTYKSGLLLCPPTSKLFATYHEQTITTKVVLGQSAWTSALRIFEGHKAEVKCVVFSPDGTKLASASGMNIFLWDIQSGGASGIVLEGHSNFVNSVIFSPDGTKLASTSWDQTVCLWDVKSATALRPSLKGHETNILTVAFSPDGTKVASGSSNRSIRGTVYLWDVETRKALCPPFQSHNGPVLCVVFSPDGKLLASASSDGAIYLLDIQSMSVIDKPLIGHSQGISSIVFSPDGTKLASASWDNTLRLWDVQSSTIIGAALKGHTATVNSVVFSPDGTKLASASHDNTVRLWDVQSGTTIGPALVEHTKSVNSVVFSPDGTKLASASVDHMIYLWDIQANPIVGSPLKGHWEAVNAVVFSPDGSKLASASKDRTVHLWDVYPGNTVDFVHGGHTDMVLAVAFSTDGKIMASASRDNTIYLWDICTGIAIGSALTGHENSVVAVMFSPDGSKLASASTDHTVKLWNVQTGILIDTTPQFHNTFSDFILVHYMAFSSDGTEVATVSFDGTALLWNITEGTASIIDSDFPIWAAKPPLAPYIKVGSDGFLSTDQLKNIIWLPLHLRGNVETAPDGTLVIAGEQGFISFIKPHYHQT